MKRNRYYGEEDNTDLSNFWFSDQEDRSEKQGRSKKHRRLRSDRRSGYLRKQAQRDAMR